MATDNPDISENKVHGDMKNKTLIALFKTIFIKLAYDFGSLLSGEKKKGRSLLFIFIVLSLGCIIISIYSFSFSDTSSTLSTSLMIAFASAVAGTLVGFIFGIPRIRKNEDTTSTVVDNNTTSDEGIKVNNGTADFETSSVQANTNLEEISDWITKIIVGVGLVELTQIRISIDNMGKRLSDALGGDRTAFVFSIAVVTMYFIGGFFLGYLWSRIFLPKILVESREESILKKLNTKVAELKKKKSELKDKLTELGSKESQLKDIVTELKEKDIVINSKVAELKEKVIKLKEKNTQLKNVQEEDKLKKAIDDLAFKADPKNFKDYHSQDFSESVLKALIDKIINDFDEKEVNNLFGKLIISLYRLENYERINQLVDFYKDEFEFDFPIWMDVALSNLNLYDIKQSDDFKKRMRKALFKVRESFPDHGVAYAIELYYHMINMFKYNRLEKDAKAIDRKKIKGILEKVINANSMTSWELNTYFIKNEGDPGWYGFHRTLEELYPELFGEIIQRFETYEIDNPQG